MKLCKQLVWLVFIINCIASQVINNDEKLLIDMKKYSNLIFPPDLNYTNINEIKIVRLEKDELTAEMQSKFYNATELRIYESHVFKAHLMENFKIVNIRNSYTRTIVINPSWNYQTEHLSVTFGNLNCIPKHLNVLKKLERLTLYNNQIEVIEMADFNGLNELRSITLQRNKIAEIRATLQNPVALPKLETFDVKENRLADISFEHWDATSLSAILLHSNQLEIALLFPHKFPSLFRVSLNNNPINCQCLRTTFEELKARKVIINHENETKCVENGPSLERLVRRVELKESFPSMALLEIKTSGIDRELELQRGLSRKLEATVGDLAANTGSKVEEIEAGAEAELAKLTEEFSTKEQTLNGKVECLEKAVLILGLFSCLVLMTFVYNFVTWYNSYKRSRAIPTSEIPIMCYQDLNKTIQ